MGLHCAALVFERKRKGFPPQHLATMMMDARAFDADLRREFAKAKTPIALVPNMVSAKSISRSAVSFNGVAPVYR
jgi:hypothetical protein